MAKVSNLDVDGPRPAVAWVASLPSSWTTEGERIVLLVLACDAFKDTSAPGADNLARWSGMHRSSVFPIVARLAKPTSKRPALIEIHSTAGGPRTRYRLCVEIVPTEWP